MTVAVRPLLGVLLGQGLKHLLDLTCDHLEVVSVVWMQEYSVSIAPLDQVEQQLVEGLVVHLVNDELEHRENARVQQVTLVRVFKEDLHHCVEDVVLDYAQDTLTVLRGDYGLEKLDDLDVDLA
jgi:uncharacterized membrane protein